MMDLLQSYSDAPNAVEDSTSLATTRNSDENVPLRTKSLLFATYPWTTVLPIVATNLVDQLGDTPNAHYAYVCHLIILYMQNNSLAMVLVYSKTALGKIS